jgi:hypothetical protein
VSGVYVAAFYIPAAFAGYLFSALVKSSGWGGAGIWQLTVLPLIGAAALLFIDTRQMCHVVAARPHH